MNKHQAKAFTLIELIVVISILAILRAIAFISLEGYSADARDSKREAEVWKFEKGIEMYATEAWEFPMPWDVKKFWSNSDDFMYQGRITELVAKNASINEGLKDPVTWEYFEYSITWDKKQYQIKYELESSKSYTDYEKAQLAWNYNNIFAFSKSGQSVAMPSLFVEDDENTAISLWTDSLNFIKEWSEASKPFSPTQALPHRPKNFEDYKNMLYNLDAIYYNDATFYWEPEIAKLADMNKNSDLEIKSFMNSAELTNDLGFDSKIDVFQIWKNPESSWYTHTYINKVISDNKWNTYFLAFYWSGILVWDEIVSSYWDRDIMVWKLDKDLNHIWHKRIWWTWLDTPKDISIDSNWDLYIVWYFESPSLNIPWLTSLPLWNVMSWFFTKLDWETWDWIWRRDMWGASWEKSKVNSVNILWDSIYVAWEFFSDTFSPEWLTWWLNNKWTTLPLDTNSDSFVLEYSTNWTFVNHSHLWCSWSDYIYWVGWDESWIYVHWQTFCNQYSVPWLPLLNNVADDSKSEAVLVKLNKDNLQWIWSKAYWGPNNRDILQDIVIGDNYVYAIGDFLSTDFLDHEWNILNYWDLWRWVFLSKISKRTWDIKKITSIYPESSAWYSGVSNVFWKSIVLTKSWELKIWGYFYSDNIVFWNSNPIENLENSSIVNTSSWNNYEDWFIATYDTNLDFVWSRLIEWDEKERVYDLDFHNTWTLLTSGIFRNDYLFYKWNREKNIDPNRSGSWFIIKDSNY